MSEAADVNERAEIGLPNDFSAILDKVLSNPDILTTVASALSGASNGTGEAESKSTDAPRAEESAMASAPLDTDVMMQKLPQIMKMLSPMISGTGAKNHAPAHDPTDKRACLLLAIKPYLSKERCEAIDYIIKFSKLSEILKTMI